MSKVHICVCFLSKGCVSPFEIQKEEFCIAITLEHDYLFASAGEKLL